MTKYYVLKGKTPVPVTLYEWSRWISDNQYTRHVAYTQLGGFTISTVFLGMDHKMQLEPPGSPPVGADLYGSEMHMERYSTWDEAAAGHERAVRSLPRYAMELQSFMEGGDTQDD
jgi:hypothetical protein